MARRRSKLPLEDRYRGFFELTVEGFENLGLGSMAQRRDVRAIVWEVIGPNRGHSLGLIATKVMPKVVQKRI
jgi:hypothetical protein